MVKRAAVHRQRFNGAGGNYNGFGRAASNNNPLFIWHAHANVQPGLCEGLEQQRLSGERLPETGAGPYGAKSVLPRVLLHRARTVSSAAIS
jgi:hypothetical protein